MEKILAQVKRFLSEGGPNRKLLIAMLALVALAALVISSLGSNSSVSAIVPNPAATSTTSKTVLEPSFYVHVVGEVKSPGVYSLSVGSRLFDAVSAAGGFLEDADQASVNLARELTDGEQIVVLKVGASSTGSTSTSAGAGSLISINRASEVELESLPGVGPALAGRIIDWRVANGGFKKKEDLLKVGGIGDKLFASISKLVSI